jgi:hypothetical protein
MSAAGKTYAFLAGAGLGIFMAFYLVLSGDNSTGIGQAIVQIESPVMIIAHWIFGKVGMELSLILHLGFWFLFGGLLFLGVGVLLSKRISSD